MPSMNNYLVFIFISLAFIAQIAFLSYFRSSEEVRANWPKYRCNPSYWIYSQDLSQDFTYCVQTSQIHMTGYLLQPMNYMISGLTSMGSEMANSINDTRRSLSDTRGFISTIIDNIFGVFLNLVIQMQKMIISIKDMVGKMIGIVVTIMYMLDGSIKTMKSVWAGPPGQLVKSIASCFHQNTLVALADGRSIPMQKVPPGSQLEDGSIVHAVLQVANLAKEPFYIMPGGVGGTSVYVTGDHFVYCKATKKWVHVRDEMTSGASNYVEDTLSCLITTNRRIRLGRLKFSDWEDDELVAKFNAEAHLR
jgi:hypothetical protein